MYQIGEFLQQFATKEVLTVIGGLVTAWVGWKAASKSLGFVSGIAKKATFMGLAAATMFMVGLGATGLGIGELQTRPESGPVAKKVGLSNDDLLKIVRNEHPNPDIVKAVLEYAKDRDNKVNKEKTEVASLKIGNKVIPVSLTENYDDSVSVTQVGPIDTKVEESVMPVPYAWSLIGLGLASAISSIAIFRNRYNTPSIYDPNINPTTGRTA